MNNTSILLKLSAKSSSKDKIIQVLSEEWPLTGKEIFNRLQKQYSIQISYQGVHKLLAELTGENVLEKQNNKYMLNKEWLNNNKAFFENVQKRYSASDGKYKINPKFEGSIVLEFDSYTNLSLWLAELFASKILISDEDNVLIGYMRYGYWPLTFDFKDFILLVKFLSKTNRGYPIIKNKTKFGEWIMKQYLKAGAIKGTFDKDLELDHDLFVHGSCIIEAYTEKEFDDYLMETYNKIGNLNDLFQNFLKNKEPETKIKVVITKNPQMARLLKNEAIKKYGGEAK